MSWHPLLRAHLVANGGDRSVIEQVADEHAMCGFRFVPLVEKDAACALDVLLLFRSEPHRLLNNAGDLDGRVKTLLDGLRKPQQCDEVTGQTPAEDEDPFYVLLEDDHVVTELNVTTDRLFAPLEQGESPRDAVAVLRVRTRTFSGNPLNIHDMGP